MPSDTEAGKPAKIQSLFQGEPSEESVNSMRPDGGSRDKLSSHKLLALLKLPGTIFIFSTFKKKPVSGRAQQLPF